jgi:hypothetical protein
MDKQGCSLGHQAAHGSQCRAGLGPTRWPSHLDLWQPTAWPVRARRARRVTNACGMTRCLMAWRWLRPYTGSGETDYGTQSLRLYTRTHLRRPRRGSSPERSSVWWRRRSASRWSNGLQANKVPWLGSLATQEGNECEEHRGAAHWWQEAKEKALTGGGRRRSRDLAWRAEEAVDGDETWGKMTAGSRGLVMWKELGNGVVERWLTSALGRKLVKGRKHRPRGVFIGDGVGVVDGGPHESVTNGQWLPCSLLLTRGRIRFEVDPSHCCARPHCALGPAHKEFFSNFSKLCLVYKIQKPTLYCSKILQTLHECSWTQTMFLLEASWNSKQNLN